MKKEVISIQDINGFSPLLLDYLSNKHELAPFFGNTPQLQSFEKQIEEKSHFSSVHRNRLVSVLEEQYQHIGARPGIQQLVDKNTFTVTTGHQLNIFTGPLYVIYKIVSTINLAHQLKKQYPSKNFIPIYWLASEDHDFEEINHFYWNQSKHEWKTDQKGAVGKFNPESLKELYQLFPDAVQFFKEAYSQASTLSEAVIRYMDYLFGDEGLICLDADHQALKALMLPVMEKDILEQAHELLVQQTTSDLQKLGYKTQVNARPINFFYLKDQLRERLEKEDVYKVVQTDMAFDAHQMREEIHAFPERFSPNVILRPLYQEIILPNLAYIGGPAEIVYWLQLKAVFDVHQVPFPILLPRNFATILTAAQKNKLDRMGLNPADLFLDSSGLNKRVLEKFGSGEQNIATQKSALASIFNEIEQKAQQIDGTLIQSVRAHLKKSENAFNSIQKKLAKAELKNQSEWVIQIAHLKEKLFPGGTWQERRDSFLNYYINNKLFIKELLDLFDPLKFEMNFLIQQEDGQ